MNAKKYIEIVKTLRKEILNGKYSMPGCSFPSERGLAKRFGVNRTAITRVIQNLSARGYLLSKQGKGTFLTKVALRSTGTIGLIVPGVAYSEFFQPIVMALSGACLEKGYGLSVASAFSSNGTERAQQALAHAHDLVEKRVCGVILQPIESIPNAPRVNRQILSIFETANVPVVLLDSDVVPMPLRSDYDIVGINNFDAGRRMAVHLLAAGAKRICFATMPHPSYCIRNRFAGAQSILASHGVLLKSMSELDAANPDDVRRLLRSERPDAILCCCDTFAAYLNYSLESLGVSVPDRILLAGFDDVQHATIITPALTTVRQPCSMIAQEAFLALLERMKNPLRPTREILLVAPLVARASTKKLKVGVKRGGASVKRRRK